MSGLDQLTNSAGAPAPDVPSPKGAGFIPKLVNSARELCRDNERRAPILFTASSLWLSVAQLLSGVVIVHFIDPRDMGLWSSVSLVLTYSLVALAGVQNGLSRELPYYLGAQKDDTARRLAATTLFYTVAGCALASLGGAGTVGYLIFRHEDPRLIGAVAGVTILVSCQFYQNYLFVTYRSKSSFLELARVQTWQAVLMLPTLVLLLLGLKGLILRALIVAVLAVYMMHSTRPLHVLPAWKTESFVTLIRTGIPIFAMDYLANCARTVDKVALLRLGGVEQVGLYALAISVFSGFAVVPQSIAHYIYPRMSHHYGRTSNPLVLWTIAWKTALVVIAAMVPLALAGYLLLPIGVRIVFPRYVGATHAAQIALFAAIGYGLTITSNVLSSLKAWKYLIAYQISYAVLLAAGPFIGIRVFSTPLDGVAYGSFGANLAGGLLALAITFAATHRLSGCLTVEQALSPVADGE